MRILGLWFLGVVPSAFAADPASSPAVPPINAQAFRPSLDSPGMVWVDDAALPDGRFGARAMLHYTLNPLVYRYDDGEVVKLVSDVVQADVAAGLKVWRLRVGVDVPVYLFEVGVSGSEVGLGDIRPDVKFSMFDGRDYPFGLAVEGRATLPTATVSNALGSPEPGWEVDVVVDRRLGSRVQLALNAGVHAGPATQLENVTLHDALVMRLAGSYALSPDAGVALELAGEKGFADAGMASFPLEGMVSGYGYLGPVMALRGGVGTGLTRGIGAPDLRVVLGVGYQPRRPVGPVSDIDADRVPDDADACPDVPEDRDGTADADGCPDPDNDSDGVPDVGDPCPTDAEDVDGVRDNDGCPEPEVRVGVRLVNAETGAVVPVGHVVLHGPVGDVVLGPEPRAELLPGTYSVDAMSVAFDPATVSLNVSNAGQPAGGGNVYEVRLTPSKDAKISVSREGIDLREKVYFDTANDVILARSFALLDQVAAVMNAYPEITLLSVEGHTDNRGDDASNLDLSLRRAQSVVNYLIRKGVAGNRLVAKGYGETRPLDPADTEAAWEANRRVDVLIESWATP
jgi:outer membrane protein OmpA-like peptidoglycan-associated protein